jgi:hypothetical protein
VNIFINVNNLPGNNGALTQLVGDKKMQRRLLVLFLFDNLFKGLVKSNEG